MDFSINLARGTQGGIGLAGLFTRQNEAQSLQIQRDSAQKQEANKNLLRIGQFLADAEERRLKQGIREEQQDQKRVLFQQQQEDRQALIDAGLGPVNLQKAELGNKSLIARSRLNNSRRTSLRDLEKRRGIEELDDEANQRRGQLGISNSGAALSDEAGVLPVDGSAPDGDLSFVGAGDTILPNQDNPFGVPGQGQEVSPVEGSQFADVPSLTQRLQPFVDSAPSTPTSEQTIVSPENSTPDEIQAGILELEENKNAFQEDVRRFNKSEHSDIRVESKNRIDQIDQDIKRLEGELDKREGVEEDFVALRKKKTTEDAKTAKADTKRQADLEIAQIDLETEQEEVDILLAEIKSLEDEGKPRTNGDEIRKKKSQLRKAQAGLKKAEIKVNRLSSDGRPSPTTPTASAPVSTTPSAPASASTGNVSSFLNNL